MAEKAETKPEETKEPEEIKKPGEEEEIPEAEETPEEAPAEAAALEETIRKTEALLSPEGCLMIGLAIILDIAGIICFILIIALGLGEVISYIPDIIGLLLIGSWTLFRSQAMPVTPRMARAVGKLGRVGRFLRPVLLIFGEFVPVIGALPLWTLFVYWELTS